VEGGKRKEERGSTYKGREGRGGLLLRGTETEKREEREDERERKGKKVKFSHTRYRALGPELIPVYRQSARR